ncbi:unnamed protein product [Mytilus edulis]|uniref:Tyr recombinase domain-containing protein n=1 Tax=Mytilus edulis TaxID=6550 RepID=A0A8S3VEI9_MYTED|nr:unnamed protein product [Mytilus edulis]
MFALASTQRSVHRGIWIKPRTTDLYRDVMNWTPNDWYENIRMSQQSFNHICDQLSVFIERMTTKFRSPHPVGKRVMVTLWRLATNIEFRTLGHLFGMGRSTAWKHHDAHVLRESSVFLKASAGELLPNWTENLDNVEVPPFIIGDPAYPSLTWLMKAYPGNNLSQEQQVFNCRLSRARMTIECAFGRLKGRWRCLIKRLDNELYSVPEQTKTNVFYLRPLSKPKENTRYTAQPIGINTLAATVGNMCTEAGLGGFRSNHSLRATAATRLYECGVDEQIISEVTGHRSDAVREYQKN